MSFATSTSLAASDSHTLKRHSSGLLHHNGGHSKQDMVAKKMFGSRKGKHGKDFQIGKKFKSKGAKDRGSHMMSSHSISPSTVEFEKMLGASVTHNPNKKKSMFSQKKFG